MKKYSVLKSFNTKSQNSFIILLKLYSRDAWKILLAVLVFLIKHSPEWILPIVTANIINTVVHPTEFSHSVILKNIIFMLILFLQNIPMHTLFMYLISTSSRKIELQIRQTIIQNLQQLSILYFKKLHSGRIQSKVLRDVEAIDLLTKQLFQVVFTGVVNIIFAIVITLYREPVIAIFYLLSMPVAFFLIQLFRMKIRRKNRYFRQEIEGMSSYVAEILNMVPILRAHSVEKVTMRKFTKQLNQVKQKGVNLDVFNSFFGSAVWATFGVMQTICLIVTSFLALKGKIPVGDIVMYQGFYMMILKGIGFILNFYPQLTKGFESISSVGEILRAGDLEKNKHGMKLKSIKGRIDFLNVKFQYPEANKETIHNFSLKVKKGETIAIIGESGVGKSTIMGLLIGFFQPTEGKILIDGIDLKNINLSSYRQFLAVVPQEIVLFSGTIKENITYGLNNVSERFLNKILNMARIDDFIRSLPDGLNTQIGEKGNFLSGGQRQRIAIARALIRNPRIIIFDEATSSLDVESEKKIQEAMGNLIKGYTTFIIAHRYSTIKYADRIVVMKEGSAVEIGTEKELVKLKGEFQRWTKFQK